MIQLFNIEKDAPIIWKELVTRCPEIGEFPRNISKDIFDGATCEEGVGQKFYRLPNHARSICLPLRMREPKFDQPTLVFKGAEPLLNDFELYTVRLAKTGFRKGQLRSRLEHFPLVEGKVAGVCLSNEIALEISAAIALQMRFVSELGTLAQIPTPLAQWKLGDETLEFVKRTIRRSASDYVWSKIETFLSSGISVGLYYYPGAPIRSDFLKPENQEFIQRHSQRKFLKSVIIEQWMDLVANILAVGSLPVTFLNIKLGSCIDSGNACIDGGLCDIDSIYPILDFPDDHFVYESMHMLLTNFSMTLVNLTGLTSQTQSENYFFYRLVATGLLKRLQLHELAGRKVDSRILQFLQGPTLEDVVKISTRPRVDNLNV